MNSVNDLPDVVCQECDCPFFVNVFRMKRLSPIASPDGKERFFPVQQFACKLCGHINDSFLDDGE